MSERNIISKEIWLWMFIGIIIFTVLLGGFTLFAEPNKCNINLELAGQSEQFDYLDGKLSATSNESQLYFSLDKDIVVNYLDISVKDLSAPTVNVRLYYADAENDFTETKSVSFYLNRGFNEIRLAIGAKKYFRMDIGGGGIVLDQIVLSSTINPIYQITQGFFFFIFIWGILYFFVRKLGICYRSVHDSTIQIVEGMFVIFMVVTMLFAIGRIQYRLIVYLLIPCVVFGLALLYSKIHHVGKIAIFSFIVLVGMSGLMCLVGYKMLSTPYTDLGTVYESAWQIAIDGKINTVYTGREAHQWVFEGSNNDYFVRFHNNIPLLALLAVYYKILSAFGLNATSLLSNYMSVLLNIVFIMATVLFGMFTAKNMFGERGMTVYLLMSFFFVPYYINACRFYTDTMSMPFVAMTLWMYTIDDKKFKVPYVKYIVIGIILGIGILMKGSVGILIVALSIHLLLKDIRNIRYIFLTIMMIAGISSMWNIYIQSCSWIDMSNDSELQFPVTHFVMMGMNREVNGHFTVGDFQYTDQYSSKAEKQKANIERIKQRIVNCGSLDAFGEYMFSKAADIWFEGQYMQDVHIGWGIEKGKIYDGLITGRKYNNLYKIYIQVFTFTMHVFCVAGGLLSIKRPKEDFAMFFRLIMLGVMVFFMLWETNSRYILNFTPVFMLTAIYGADKIEEYFNANNIDYLNTHEI